MRRNAWLVTISETAIGVTSGHGVETTDDFIAEGAWAGPYSAPGLLESSFRCASGVVFGDKETILCPPTHSVEPIYLFSREDQLIASNSLHLIVAYDESAAPLALGKARQEARTLKAGRYDYGRVLYETLNGVMKRFAFGNVRISNTTLNVVEDPMNLAPQFTGYQGYYDHLLDTLSSLVGNARNPGRVTPYGPVVTTASSGYDSAACAALAKQLGATDAVTLTTGRGNISDSGKPVADALGLNCYEYERFGSNLATQGGKSEYASFLDASHLQAEHADFLATMNTTEDLYFSSFEPHLPGAIVLTGFHGDKAWDMGCTSGDSISRGDNSGSGLDEFRKRVGFVSVPVPYIGVEHHDELERICSSDDMEPYRVGGRYDRPIPRRIAEDAGVPREVFGFKKSMGSVLLSNTGRLRSAAFRGLVEEYSTALRGDGAYPRF